MYLKKIRNSSYPYFALFLTAIAPRNLRFAFVPQMQSRLALLRGWRCISSGAVPVPKNYNAMMQQLRGDIQHPYRSFSTGRAGVNYQSGSRAGGGARRSSARELEIKKKNENFASWMLAMALGTLGVTYLSVPLYRMFCQMTGFGGTIKDAEDIFITSLDEVVEVIEDRPLKMRFNSDVSANIPWKFHPTQQDLVIFPGETVLAFYKAENISDKDITGIATYNVTPSKVGIYFNKVQCFCFDEQRLKAGEKIDMPVFFYIDPEFAKDPNMNDVKDITLSYTFFRAEDVTPEELQRQLATAMGQ